MLQQPSEMETQLFCTSLNPCVPELGTYIWGRQRPDAALWSVCLRVMWPPSPAGFLPDYEHLRSTACARPRARPQRHDNEQTELQLQWD